MDYKLSVIIPIYNADAYLTRCLNSLVKQSYNNLEILLIDDGSTDNSSNICKLFVKKYNNFKYIYQNNSGVSSARNRGLNVCTGDYVTFIDSDDYIDNECYYDMMNAIKDNDLDIIKFSFVKECGIIKKNYCFTTQTNLKISYKEYKNMVYKNIFNTNDYCNIWNCIIRKEIASKIRFNKEYTLGEDYLYFVDCLKISKNIKFDSRIYYHYTFNPNSITHSIDFSKIEKKILDSIFVNEEVYKLLGMNNLKNASINRAIESIESNVNELIRVNSYCEYVKFIENIFKNQIIVNFINLNYAYLSKSFTDKLKKKKLIFYKTKVICCIKSSVLKILGK